MADVVPDEIEALEPADGVPHDPARVLVLVRSAVMPCADTARRR